MTRWTDILLVLILLALPGGATVLATAGAIVLWGLLGFVIVILPACMVWGWVAKAYDNFKNREIRRDPRWHNGGYHYANGQWLRWNGEDYQPDTEEPRYGFWPDGNALYPD